MSKSIDPRMKDFLRQNDFRFKRKNEKHEMWRKKGGTRRVYVPRQQLSDDQVRTIFSQTGLSPEEQHSWLAWWRSV